MSWWDSTRQRGVTTMDLPRPVMLTAWCVGVVAATLPVVPTAAQMTVVPRVVHMEQIACAELLALPSERQDRLLIYFDGYVAGMRRQTTWDERVEGEMIDRAIGSRGLIVIGSVLACFLARAVGAQDQAADNMNILREKARADKKVVVASVLDLTEKEATVFWPVYNAYQSDMVTHYDLLLKLIDAYGKAYNAMSDETATKLLADYLALERAHVALLSSVRDRKSTRLNSSHTVISYAVFCLKKKKMMRQVLTHSHRQR